MKDLKYYKNCNRINHNIYIRWRTTLQGYILTIMNILQNNNVTISLKVREIIMVQDQFEMWSLNMMNIDKK